MKKLIIFLLLLAVFSLNIVAQRKTFQEKLEMLNITYNSNSKYKVLSDTVCYMFIDNKCPMGDKVQLVEGKLLSRSEECMVGVYFPPFYMFYPNIVEETKNNRFSSHDRIAYDFNWGKRLRSASEQDLNDIESLMRHYAIDTAKVFFNADYMFSYPLNFQGEKCDDRFRYGRAVIFGKEGVINIILYFITTERGIKNIDNYILDTKGMFKFEKE